MTTPSRRIRALAPLIAASLALQVIPAGTARAGMIGTAAHPDGAARMPAPSARAPDRARISAFLARAEVRRSLARQGVDPGQAEARIAALSDREVAALAARIDRDPAGGLVGELLLAGVIGLLVLLVADATGHTDVF